MANKILYTTMIAAVSVVLISVMVFQAEAKTFDKGQEFGLKGLGIAIFGQDENGNKLQLQISPIENSKDVFVDYKMKTLTTDLYKGQCIGPKQILKVSATNKASVEFNTGDLNCSVHQGPDSIISATIEGTGQINANDKYDSMDCYTIDNVDYCTRDRGSYTEFIGVGNISGFGLSLDNQQAAIKDVKLIHTAWTSP